MAVVSMERKLAAILSADVQGYSRLMAEDDEGTVRTLMAYREVMSSLIRQHRGRVVDPRGTTSWPSLPVWWMLSSVRSPSSGALSPEPGVASPPQDGISHRHQPGGRDR